MSNHRNKISNKNKYLLLNDFLMIAVGIIIAIIFVKTGILDILINAVKDYYMLASFIAGIFFTSIFTLAPASIALVHIAETSPIGPVVLWGALGAMCGDLILFFFIRDRFTEDLKRTIRPSTMHHILHSFHFGFLKWLAPLIGALIIASPLPDEIGISLLGMSKVKTTLLIPISFVMNMLGIYVLLGFVHLI